MEQNEMNNNAVVEETVNEVVEEVTKKSGYLENHPVAATFVYGAAYGAAIAGGMGLAYGAMLIGEKACCKIRDKYTSWRDKRKAKKEAKAAATVEEKPAE